MYIKQGAHYDETKYSCESCQREGGRVPEGCDLIAEGSDGNSRIEGNSGAFDALLGLAWGLARQAIRGK